MLKHLHMSCAALSGALFLLRGLWMLQDSPRLRQRWVRTLPHLIDTVLLASAVALAVWSAQYPLAQPWLTAKVCALLLYIVLGSVALKRGRSNGIRAAAFLAALATFAYIVAVALSKTPFPLA
ncbi:SirB2 family protein [Noviherbaspirillum soli]|uniref:SirB2 family protein n=1 Tax=Noviherbaspirillum soli TaxID=1064518 RepID=UPI002B2657E1|nr:SirB2 family protein [Noviherbaspirillum soli]